MIGVLSVVGGGIAGSMLSFALTLRREQRRTRDAYRSPQRAAIASIVAAVNDLVLRANDFQTFIDNSANQAEARRGSRKTEVRSPYTDAEADLISGQVNRAIIGIDEAFAIGKLTVVDGLCYEAMVVAYKEFAKVQEAFIDIDTVPRTPDSLRTVIKPFVDKAVQLRTNVRRLIDVGHRQLAPTQSLTQERELAAVKARLKSKYPDLK
ncbi:hypothetical protein MTOK_42410 [Mycolicibacterium tokaiense]|nr:hypothetical protein MTOK_42410 [Mycolicibacterium tokaiense]